MSSLEMDSDVDCASRYSALGGGEEAPAGAWALLCPCLRKKPSYAPLDGGADCTINPLAEAGLEDGARSSDRHRGAWLDERDELADACFGCESEFHAVKNRRHHCRRCGDTYCLKCASRYAPLLISGLDQPQRVCDGCYEAAKADNAFAARHAKVLARGAVLELRGGGLFRSGRATVALRVDGDALALLDRDSQCWNQSPVDGGPGFLRTPLSRSNRTRFP